MSNQKNKEEINEHKVLQQAALYGYDMKKNEIPEGCKLLGTKHNWITGFEAVILKKDNDIIISFVGTESYVDMTAADLDIILGTNTFQTMQALGLVAEITKQYPSANIILTGHSLGGALAQYAAAILHCSAVTFNALGAKSLIKKGDVIDTSRIVNYCNPRDMIASQNASKHLGKIYCIKSKAFTSKKETHWREHHDIEVMEDLQTREAISAEELSRRYHNYKKNKRLDEMDEIEYYKRHGRIKPIRMPGLWSDSKPCAGTYPVSSYTRDDGTKVEGYTRTCGAKHLSTPHKKRFDEMTEEEIDQLIDERIKAKWRYS